MEGFSPVRKARVYQEITAQIERLIVDGRFSPGDRLPPEREMADLFKVSRNSVRDALRTLEAMGLVECRHGDGIYVSSVTPETLIAPLATLLTTKRGLITELMDLRRILEPPVAYYAAERATSDDIRELEDILSRQERKARLGELTVDEDKDFHYHVAAAAKNEMLLLVLSYVMSLLGDSRSNWLQNPVRIRASLKGHEKVLEAIKARDPTAAREYMLEHIETIAAAIRE